MFLGLVTWSSPWVLCARCPLHYVRLLYPCAVATKAQHRCLGPVVPPYWFSEPVPCTLYVQWLQLNANTDGGKKFPSLVCGSFRAQVDQNVPWAPPGFWGALLAAPLEPCRCQESKWLYFTSVSSPGRPLWEILNSWHSRLSLVWVWLSEHEVAYQDEIPYEKPELIGNCWSYTFIWMRCLFFCFIL